jgi:catechol 2,3-dioxygenase
MTDPPYGVRPPAYRLPDATHVGRVKLQIADLQRSVAYYTEILGLRVVAQSATSASLAPHDSDEVIVELHEKKGVRTVPRRGLLGLFHFAILLPDRPALGRFLSHLAKLEIPAGMSDHFVSEAIYLQDPDNLGIEVYADRPRDSWRHEDRQLQMATVPLDAHDVMSSAGGKPWTGAPSGTRMGHVHLHVGDLAQAEEFYHKALGLDKIVWNYPGALFMSAGGYHHHLGTNTWARGAPSASSEDAKLLEWELKLPTEGDVEAAAKSLSAAGNRAELEGATCVTADPWGTQLRLTA